MIKYKMIQLLFMFVCFHAAVHGKVFILTNNSRSTLIYNDRQAKFGRDIPDRNGILGILALAKPLNACIPLTYTPIPNPGRNYVFVVVEESNSQETCSYETQARHAQSAGYNAVLIYRRESDLDILEMKGDGPAIIAVSVTKEAGNELLNSLYYTGSMIRITTNVELPFQLYLIPFVVVISICFFFMILFSLGRYCRFRMRERRSRLSPANLKRIPTKKFKKGDEYDICAICIEDYEENEKIRILPCNHAYHTKCVDPWLTAGKKLCPVCKQSVETDKKKKKKKKKKERQRANIRNYDQASTSSRNSEGDSANDNDDGLDSDVYNERTPLLSDNSNQLPSQIPSSGALNV